MIYTTEEAAEQNRKALAGLREIFQMLGESGALVGRNNARIAVDLRKTSTIIRKKMSEIFGLSQLVVPNGIIGVFESIEEDQELGILLLNIGQAIREGESAFAEFPYYSEVKDLLQSIPVLPEEHSSIVEEIHKQINDHLEELIRAWSQIPTFKQNRILH